MKVTNYRSTHEYFFDCPYCEYSHTYQSFMNVKDDTEFFDGGMVIACENCNKKFQIAKHGNDTGWMIT